MQTVGIKLSMDVGGLVSSSTAAKESIRELEREIEKAQKAGDLQKVGQLYTAKGRLEAASNGFERDTNRLIKDPRYQQMMDKQMSGQPLSKDQERLASELHNNSDKLGKYTTALIEAIKNGNPEEIMKQSMQFGQQADEFHKAASENPDFPDPAGGKAPKDIMQAIGVHQIATAINDGFSRWVGALDRSGIVNQYGSGDIWGGRIAEQRRQADFAGGILQSVLSIGGTALGFALGGPGGAMLGGTLGGAAGQAANSALNIGPNQEATQSAYAGLWQQRSGQAMELAAITGSPNEVRAAFKMAADAAAEFGYSAEEGMDAMKQAARQGLSGKEAADIAGRTFDYERRTGADRDTLMGISTMSARYGAGDALGMGWAGLQASGMKSGQYNEYLRAMQRVMEEGISKGFLHSSERVAQNLTMLSRMTDNDPLWQGENGARRLSEMDAGLGGTTDLSSSSDIIAFRAAKQILGDDASYVDVMKLVEEGLNGEHGGQLLKNIIALSSKQEGGGREGIIERLRQIFNLDYTKADVLYKGYDPNMEKESSNELARKYATGGPPPASSPELEAAKNIEEIKNLWTQTGIMKWDENFPETLLAELRKAKQEHDNASGNIPEPADTSGMSPAEAAKTRQNEYIESLKSGNKDRITQASIATEMANMNALAPQPFIDPIDEETRARGIVGTQTRKMFDEFWESREDKEVFKNTNSIVDSALSSGNHGEREAAIRFSKILESMKETEKGAIERHNKDNTWNQLGSAGDIYGMIAILERIARNLEDIHISEE